MPLATDKITLTAEELQSRIAEEVENRLAVERAARRPQLTTGEHLAIRTWLNDLLSGNGYRYDSTIDKMLLQGVVNESRILELVHEKRRQTKGGATKYDRFFLVTPEVEDEDEEGEDA